MTNAVAGCAASSSMAAVEAAAEAHADAPIPLPKKDVSAGLDKSGELLLAAEAHENSTTINAMRLDPPDETPPWCPSIAWERRVFICSPSIDLLLTIIDPVLTFYWPLCLSIDPVLTLY